MNRLTIRRFDIVRTANMIAMFYVMLALVFGLFIFLPIALIGGIAGSRGDNGAGAALGVGLVGGLIFYLLIVVFYAIFGWIFGAIAAAVYNFVAGRIGGFQLDVTLQGPYGGAPGAQVPVAAYPGYPAQGYNAYPQGYAPAPAPSWQGPGTPGGPPSAPA
jgi:hypothetical protein